jgi:hypothetical protein
MALKIFPFIFLLVVYNRLKRVFISCRLDTFAEGHGLTKTGKPHQYSISIRYHIILMQGFTNKPVERLIYMAGF